MSRTKIVMAAFAALVAGTLLIVYAYRGEDGSRAATQTGQEILPAAEADRPQAMAESEAAKPEAAPVPKSGSEVPKSESEKATPATPPGAAAPPPGTPEVIYDFNRLPDEIRDTLQSIVVAAQSGNIDQMLPVLEENELPPMLSATAVSDPIGFWKKASADGEGRDILAAMMNVFSSGFMRKGEGKDVMYIWPYFAEMDLTKLTPAQEVDFYRVVPPPLGVEMRKSGKYTYYRAGIGADGVWHYFLK
jgi:hypothetical protein